MYAGFVAVMECRLPTVAAVNGPALGAGMNLALACDVIVCSPPARFETRFLDVGLHPGGGHLWQLRRRLGRQGAAALSLFGESLDGEEAARRQLAWRCVPEGQLETAWQLAARAAGHDPSLVALTRQTLDDSTACGRASDAIDLELGLAVVHGAPGIRRRSRATARLSRAGRRERSVVVGTRPDR
jgi:enoyl-CoA hydratase/carnithine racemase